MLVFYLSILDNDEDRAKFERIYNAYCTKMKRYAARYVGDDYLAEDIVHEAFIRIAHHIDGVEEENVNKTNAFIVTIVRRICYDEVNRRTYDVVYDEEYDQNYICGSTVGAVLEEVDYNELVRIIRGFPEIYRDVLMLRYYHGYSDKEIASLLNASPDAIRKRLERARELLAYHLKDKSR